MHQTAYELCVKYRNVDEPANFGSYASLEIALEAGQRLVRAWKAMKSESSPVDSDVFIQVRPMQALAEQFHLWAHEISVEHPNIKGLSMPLSRPMLAGASYFALDGKPIPSMEPEAETDLSILSTPHRLVRNPLVFVRGTGASIEQAQDRARQKLEQAINMGAPELLRRARLALDRAQAAAGEFLRRTGLAGTSEEYWLFFSNALEDHAVREFGPTADLKEMARQR